jgi:hypothetical protein
VLNYLRMPTFDLEILAQPNDETCGATCLQAIYQYYGHKLDLHKLITEIPTLETGGTLAVSLGFHALAKGFKATVYTYNLHVFDPTWFQEGVDLKAKLQEQLEYKGTDKKLQWASIAYWRFLERGGEIKFEELNHALLRHYLDQEIPILTGLNATYLYRSARELDNEYDDLRGTPMGHFVVLHGYDREKKQIMIADPLKSNPFSGQQYTVDIDRCINSIMLGILTYDANFLVIEKPESKI